MFKTKMFPLMALTFSAVILHWDPLSILGTTAIMTWDGEKGDIGTDVRNFSKLPIAHQPTPKQKKRNKTSFPK